MKRDITLKLSRLRDIRWSEWDPIGLLPKGEIWDHKNFADEYDSKYIQNIWDLKSIGSRQSFINKGGLIYDTQKPYELLKRIILQSSNQGDLIYDAFVGSGTTAEVARDFGRNFIGCDISDKSIQICKSKNFDVVD